MFDGPIRGGTRGGQGEFKWSDVSADKDRENYLGHSINAPTGRWQKNKDVHWYNRDLKAGEAERLEEIRKVKEAEEDALAVALGFKPAVRPGETKEGGSESGAKSESGAVVKAEEGGAVKESKEERRRRKEERRRLKEEKRARKEARRAVKYADSDGGRRRRRDSRSRSRSRSPRRLAHSPRRDVRSRSPRRSRSPPRRIGWDNGRGR